MSVFTYDPDPPRVSSPWHRSEGLRNRPPVGQASDTGESFKTGLLSDYGVTRLEPEPQEGPTEYKLHLLLRPRKSYKSMSTSNPAKVVSTGWTPPSPSPQTRQARLEHLTTQLLWRLQQSVPYHAASTKADVVVPKLLTESIPSNGHVEIGKLVPGLEASRGALYEIGVGDDGALMGLTADELDESLATLRVMAASLGCNMRILRKVIVGECERAYEPDAPENAHQSGNGAGYAEPLWVAEALVTPELGGKAPTVAPSASTKGQMSRPTLVEALPDTKQGPLTRDQLRVTLTGPTTSGKSTLLGTLSMGGLDNGHGKSRLSLLKHLHEVASGVTSSIAQELIGYRHNQIFNYGHSGIESWIDIHDFTKDGRLVHLLDSAGHPRYRRTILRGVVGWAPHWTLLCIAADGTDGSTELASAENSASITEPVPDLAQAHLDLCLSLGLPFTVAMTKMDLASRPTLQRTLGKILSKVKGAGRTAKILQPDQTRCDDHLKEVPSRDTDSVSAVIDAIREAGSLQKIVPIVLTSAVKGTGIGLIHALLRSLPLPPTPTSHDYTGPALNPEQPSCLFHIDDRFSLPASYASLTPSASQQTDIGTVIAGYLRFGSLSVGDKVLIGPFESEEDGVRGTTPEDRSSPGSYALSVSHPSSTELSRIATRNAVSASAIKGEWHSAHIVSIRNLRLPVQTIQAGQAGSIGIVFDLQKEADRNGPFESRPHPVPKPRKGMVLAIPSKHMVDTGLSLQAASGLTGSFPNLDVSRLSSGLLVTIYVASVRSAARVLRISRVLRPVERGGTAAADDDDDDDDVFNLDDQLEGDAGDARDVLTGDVEVQLELLTNREWVELGSRIVLLEGAGLDCIVGKVVEIVD